MRDNDGLWSGKERNQDERKKPGGKGIDLGQVAQDRFLAPDNKYYKNSTEYYRAKFKGEGL